MKNQIDYRDGADINTVPDIESELLFGKGQAYGLEILLKKNTGKLTGWIGYTLSKTEMDIVSGAWIGSFHQIRVYSNHRHEWSLKPAESDLARKKAIHGARFRTHLYRCPDGLYLPA